MITLRNNARPFVKWVGGKGQLLLQLENQLPHELYERDFTYIEPFVGGGAMLFFMLQKFPNINKVVINDINSNLAEAYRTIKDKPEELVSRLKQIESQYKSLEDHSVQKEFFLKTRRCFNEDKLSSLEKTAFFIFLNRTCFNGLYRENSKGFFNVPFGRYSNPAICNEEVIYADSELLNKFDVLIMNADYSQTIKAINDNNLNFFYFDPPYRPVSKTSNFNTYVKDAFNDGSQRELADFCMKINNLDNVRWMLSNSDCSAKNPEDKFFEELYDGFNIQRVYASRMVNSVASKRGKLTELLIRNYDNAVSENQSEIILKKAL